MLEIEDQSSIAEVSRVIHGLFQWGGQAITVGSVVATQDLITKIIREWGFRGKNKSNWSKNNND